MTRDIGTRHVVLGGVEFGEPEVTADAWCFPVKQDYAVHDGPPDGCRRCERWVGRPYLVYTLDELTLAALRVIPDTGGDK